MSIVANAQADSLQDFVDSIVQNGEKTTNQIVIHDSSVVNATTLPANYQNEYKDNKDFDYNEVPTRNIGKEIQDWLIRQLMKLFDITQRDVASRIVDNILTIVYILIFIAVIWFIIKAVLRKEGRWIFSKSKKEITEESLNVATSIEETDLETLIAKYANEHNYRMAIRYYFVWMLKKLGEQNIIQVEQDKTASQYAYEISNDNLRKEYQYATYLYNYIWFGEFDVNQQEYDHASIHFKKVIGNA